jgi:hypothetical protein
VAASAGTISPESEQARRAQFFGYNLTFWSHLRFGLPSTIIITAIGLLIVASY